MQTTRTAQADLSFRWAYMSEGTFSPVAANLKHKQRNSFNTNRKLDTKRNAN